MVEHRYVWAGLPVMLVVLSGCESRESRQARQVLDLVHRMGLELQAAAAESATAFMSRPDFEEARRGFGTEAFDAGVPPGLDFRNTLQQMSRDLDAQLEKEPKDRDFSRKAAQRVRRFAQWWMFARQTLTARRDQVLLRPSNTGASQMLDLHSRHEGFITVLNETIKAVESFEAITQRCLKGIETVITQS